MNGRQFISPSEACLRALRVFKSAKDAQSFLLHYASSGDIYVKAEKTFEEGKNEAPNKRISADTIRKHKAKLPSSFWSQATWNLGKTEYVGISFDSGQVSNAIKKHAGSFSQAYDPHTGLKVGRSAGKHGEPIAALTLRYMTADAATLNRLTAISLEGELAAEYKQTGHEPPSSQNREAICAGIIRAIKHYRTI